ncbi:flagellar assembly protein FliH [Accumulibacter sp.]|uniref:Flagellar assembly protein FliH n=1 Tax=Candidatus Accumulibacter proximus TaxID=2954385 RepID=A0A935UFZ2_9PROT|nr:flagellar assembly protein FliH [Accumulibacter sp.]MBK7673898.1 flagellar assembly protein FliH [Candidatus Accumulibacter proximus]MBL8373144.1 flagellar assembly protein FliH [Accumulibacter sp.]
MSNWIPKEKLTAYQRWEVAAFDEVQRDAEASAPQDPPPEKAPPALAAEPANEPPGTPVVLPTAADIERMYGEAHDTGYAAGYTEGIAAAKAVVATIATLMDSLTQALAGIEQGVADQLLALAIEIANQVLRQSLRLQPELLLPIVREAVTTLQPHHGQPLLFVHPDDATLVRKHLGEQLSHSNWRIIEDRLLTAGGCRVELGASEVDATLETRWRRVVEAIGVNQEWLKSGREANPR